MASDISYNKDFFTPERIQQLQQILRDNPIDPAYDEACENLAFDERDPTILLQATARSVYKTLKGIGELPEDLRRPDALPGQKNGNRPRAALSRPIDPKKDYSAERTLELQQWLRDHPIDPAYDARCEDFENYDADDPVLAQQSTARLVYESLEESGDLPEDLRRDKTPPAK